MSAAAKAGSGSRRGLALLGIAVALAAGSIVLARSRPGATPVAGSGKPAPRAATSVALTDITREAGLDFIQSHGGCGENYFVEQVAAGVAVFDADGDGNLDLYFPQPKPIGPCKASLPEQHQRLYLGDGHGHFRLSPDAFGGKDTDYAIGVAVGDYDNDGHPDLYVTCWGRNVLYHNDGHGHFTDVTAKAGVGHTGFSTSAAWFDYDGDGFLDLYVANYAHYLLSDNITCYTPTGEKDVCTPTTYPPAANVLYHNNGDGTFTEVTARANALIADRRSLGIAALDFDGDGRVDLFVANDLSPNSLLHNNGDGTFTDMAMQQGVALGASGKAQANMGLAVGDYDHDGRPDVVVTTFANEPYTLYHNHGLYFSDDSTTSGVGPITLAPLAFGACFLDVDNDGYLDLFFANGHVSPHVKSKSGRMDFPQPNQLLLNNRQGQFTDASAALPKDDIRVHRGAAYGDFNGDGALDLIVTANNGRPTLLRNDTPPGSWLGVKLIAANGCVTPVGATCTIEAGGQKQVGFEMGGGSYASQSDYTLHFGLGTARKVDRLTIRWPSGKIQALKDLPVCKLMTVREP